MGKRPDFKTLWKSYSTITPYSRTRYPNQCSIILSRTLNSEGTIKIVKDRYREPMTRDGQAARGAESLAEYLALGRNLGRPLYFDNTDLAKRLLKPEQGIIFFKDVFTRPDEVTRRGDHIDLWNRGRTKGFDDPGNRAQQVRFWSLSRLGSASLDLNTDSTADFFVPAGTRVSDHKRGIGFDWNRDGRTDVFKLKRKRMAASFGISKSLLPKEILGLDWNRDGGLDMYYSTSKTPPPALSGFRRVDLDRNGTPDICVPKSATVEYLRDGRVGFDWDNDHRLDLICSPVKAAQQTRLRNAVGLDTNYDGRMDFVFSFR